jgi:hypothetical protein
MRLKTLNGAPLAEHLDFGEDNLLKLQEDGLLFRTFSSQENSQGILGSAHELNFKWRRIEAKSTRLRSGWSQPYLPRGTNSLMNPGFSYSNVAKLDLLSHSFDETSYLEDTTYTITEDLNENDDYFQHSIMLHDTMLSSQIAAENDEGADNTISSSSFLSTSFDSVTTELANVASGVKEGTTLQLPPKLAVTSLADIPDPKFLQSIYPQTPTPTFICVITDDVEVREVIVKRGYRMNLYDVTVADPTSTGFKISFWFRPVLTRDQAQETLRRTLKELRVGDVVLLRNIALNVFRDKVYGQSLSPKISKARTSVEILYRADGSSGYKNILPAAVDDLFGTVKKWAKAHVAPAYVSMKKRKADEGDRENLLKKALKKSSANDDGLPPDTLEPY